mmetsp:Transcript_46684/g.133140  ORF Transcript_46684/g.133140 Transcript_46684/m.133140 type:complete len:176 (+) Transcript_46684:117-644(+)
MFALKQLCAGRPSALAGPAARRPLEAHQATVGDAIPEVASELAYIVECVSVGREVDLQCAFYAIFLLSTLSVAPACCRRMADCGLEEVLQSLMASPLCHLDSDEPRGQMLQDPARDRLLELWTRLAPFFQPAGPSGAPTPSSAAGKRPPVGDTGDTPSSRTSPGRTPKGGMIGFM